MVASNNVPRVQPEPAPVEPAPAARPEPAPPAPPPPPAARDPAPPAVREPAPRASPPAIDADLAAQARRLLADSIPYSAARAQGELSRVMWIAANASRPGQERAVVDAVRQSWSSYQVVTSASTIAPAVGRQLGEDARHAYLVDRDMSRAFDLQMRAFGANPRDPEVAGNLAFLLLKVQPSQAESARQLAIHAIALAAAQRTGRSDDWTTLAIAQRTDGTRHRRDQRALRRGRTLAKSRRELQGGGLCGRRARRAHVRARFRDDGAHPRPGPRAGVDVVRNARAIRQRADVLLGMQKCETPRQAGAFAHGTDRRVSVRCRGGTGSRSRAARRRLRTRRSGRRC